MNIAVMSDSHDHIWNLQKAIRIIRQQRAAMIIHCGDFVAPFMLKELGDSGIPVHGVFGNNDGDQYQLTKMSLVSLSRVTLHGLVGRLDVQGIRIGFTHEEIVGKALAAAGGFQIVCMGHSHEHLIERIGATLLVNPGEIMGKNGNPGFCFVDTETVSVRRVDLI